MNEERWTPVRKHLGMGMAAILLVGAVGATVGAVALATPAAAVPSGPQVFTLNYSGGAQYFTVPPGVTSATFDLFGAQGSNSSTYGGGGGRGGESTAALTNLVPGTSVQVNIGGQGGFNGGAAGGAGGGYSSTSSQSIGGPGARGGGATDVRIGGTTLASRVLVAGGGGGSGTGVTYQSGGGGGPGGGTSGNGGGGTNAGAGGGGGGSATGGGGGGRSACILQCKGGPTGSDGSGGTSGIGGDGAGSVYSGGGGGGGGYFGGGGGGGGAGYYGGGAGAAGGGGGSGYGPAGTVQTTGVQSGNGKAVISYNGPLLASVVVTASSSPTLAGYPDTYTAAITPPSGSPTPLGSGGTASFSDQGVAIPGCQNLALSAGTPTCTVTYGLAQLANHTITATYSGDPTYLGNTGSLVVGVTKGVTPNAVTTTITTNQGTTTPGTPVTLTATLGVASGSLLPYLATTGVAFSDNGTPITGCGAVPITSPDLAVCSTTFTTTGPQAITTRFAGDANFTASTGGPLAMVSSSYQLTYNSTGASQTFTVPGGVSAVSFEVKGGQGGAGCSSGGLGATGWITVPATYGQVFTVDAGGQGGHGGGFNGGGGGGASPGWPIGKCITTGGGGGASDVRTGGTELSNVVITAAGGGGGSDGRGGAAGVVAGGGGSDGGGTSAGGGGGGGTRTGGGGGGGGFWAGGGGGTSGRGGGGGSTGSPGSGGGGGGGGYFGGGGGGASISGGGGGGGSSFGAAGATFGPVTNAGDGKVLVSFSPANVVNVSLSATEVYGGTPTYLATYSGFTGGDGPSSLGGTVTCSSPKPTDAVGTAALAGCSGLSSSKYYITYTLGSLTVTPAPLAVTVTGTQPLGGTPKFVPAYSGFVNQQTAALVTGTLACSTSATSSSPVGTGYTISNCSGLAAPNYTLNYNYGTLTVQQAPTITSTATTSFTVGATGTFAVTTGARFPTAETLSETGRLPTGVTFIDNGDGTATLAGKPGADAGGLYPVVITAANGVVPNAVQPFTLTVNETPLITSRPSADFNMGTTDSFTVTTAHAYPAATTLSESGALPNGLTFVDNGNGTATLAGTPAVGSGGVYPLIITAANGISPADTQSLTVTVSEPVHFTSPDTATLTAGHPGTFTVTTSHGHPVPRLSEVGTLPSGVTFLDQSDGSARLTGTPAAGSGGTYTLAITADNDIGAPVQTLVLTVEEAAVITSGPSATFSVARNGTFTVTTAHRYPLSTTLDETGKLPAGVSFIDNRDGTATLAGTPAAGTAGVYPLTIVSSNGISPAALQPFTLTVDLPTDVPLWTVASDGGIFSFGDAAFYGSMGGQPLERAHRRDRLDPERPRLLDGGQRRWHLLLR